MTATQKNQLSGITSTISILNADAYYAMQAMPAHSVAAIVTDPPYAIRPPRGSATRARDELNSGASSGEVASRDDQWKNYADAAMLGQQSMNWHARETHSRGYADNDPVHFERWCELWLHECLRVLKPGGYLVAFGGTRTWHRLACAAETVGFEIRDSLAWLYGTGFPKSLNVAKGVADLAQTEPSSGAGASAWTGWGTALKPAFEPIVLARAPLTSTVAKNVLAYGTGAINVDGTRLAGGRWPTNVFLDEPQARVLDQADLGGPSRFFWHAKPGNNERVVVDGVKHPTVKPLALMRELVRLVTPLGGMVLDPFAGSGTTVEACIAEGMSCIAIEREADFIPLIEARISRRSGPESDDRVSPESDRLF
ncbi:site-specific DNA-methyltransferase [Nocardioides sp. WS12]|uniref:DNA-methyltransferase n=1 Tax=Nocardioides sp. WS12 TaxID=2486272 RepID=UPI0015F8D411|nr:site-specific DNA-methyltransferase [Nocardioides sp. WS12]